MAAWPRMSRESLTKRTICDWRTDLRGPLVTNKWDRILRCYSFQKTGPGDKQSLSGFMMFMMFFHSWMEFYAKFYEEKIIRNCSIRTEHELSFRDLLSNNLDLIK